MKANRKAYCPPGGKASKQLEARCSQDPGNEGPVQGRDLIPDLLCEEGEACDPQRRIQVWPGSQGSCTSTSLDLSPRVENNGEKKKQKERE